VKHFEEAVHHVRQGVGVRKLLLVVAVTLLGVLLHQQASAQGCIVARSTQLTNGPGRLSRPAPLGTDDRLPPPILLPSLRWRR